jgi:hypothetical protein
LREKVNGDKYFDTEGVLSPSLFFISFFTLPRGLATPMPTRIEHAYISAWGGEFCRVSIFVKLVCQTVGGAIFLILPKLDRCLIPKKIDRCQVILPKIAEDAQLQQFGIIYLANLGF